jgi:hypothetical protein
MQKKMTDVETISQETIKSKIFTIRGKQVMMDRDLAVLYGVETKVLNQAVKRNLERFPETFRYQLTKEEQNELVTNCDRFKVLKHSASLMHSYTEQGIAMLSTVLRSETAIRISIEIMSAFVEMRRFLIDNANVFLRLENMERKQIKTDKNIDKIFNALESSDLKPKQGIFYDGQVFDAYIFIADIIRLAKTSIVLFDNYVDDTVLRLFTKRNKGVSLTIYTQTITAQLALDLKKHNAQYSAAVIKEFKGAHDRFLIIDGTIVYHIGASLKDLGKKWFAFSKMDIAAIELLSRLPF